MSESDDSVDHTSYECDSDQESLGGGSDIMTIESSLPNITPPKAQKSSLIKPTDLLREDVGAEDFQLAQLRVHVTDSFTDENILAWVHEHFLQYLYCIEFDGTKHMHILLCYPVGMTLKDIRKLWNANTEKPANFTGNKNYSLSKAKNKLQLIKYVLKPEDEDKVIGYKGFSESFVSEMTKLAYRKYSKESFAKQLDDLDNSYISATITKEEYSEGWYKLKLEHRQIPKVATFCDRFAYVNMIKNKDYKYYGQEALDIYYSKKVVLPEN